MRTVYLDHAATTRLQPEIFAAMKPYFCEDFGNAASPHLFGEPAARAVVEARRRVAGLLHVTPEEVYFTSGGTESDNLAILGVTRAQKAAGRGHHLITSAIEHPAVLETCRYLERSGDFRVTYLPVNEFGRVRVEDVQAAIGPDTILITGMAVNNVLGTIQPLRAIGTLARDRGIPFHTDAVQAAGKIPLELDTLPVDLLSLSGHKFYGPKGTGVLVVRTGTPYQPASYGAGHERGLRSGTHNTPGIVGLSLALEMVVSEIDEVTARLRSLEARVLGFLAESLPDARHVGHPTERVAGCLTLSFPGLIGYNLLQALSRHGIAVSSGPACHAAAPQPLPVLTAVGLPPELAIASIRITMGRATTGEDIDYLLEVLPKVVAEARAAEPVPAA